jgi:diacylglycerol kinase (ATP)
MTETTLPREPAGGPVVPRTRRRLMVFANQYAGALSRLKGEQPLVRYAREAGFEPELVFTRSRGHLRHVLWERVIGKEKMIALAGGDGTIHNAVQVLARSGVTLGIIPQGTANNFANALRLPLDLPTAFKVLAEGEEREVDLGECDGQYFTEAAGVGIFADTLYFAQCAGRNKNVLRTAAVALRLFMANRVRRLMLVVDGEPYVEEAFNVTVANSFMVSYNMPIAPYARLTDDQLDVVVIGALSRREMFSYVRAIRSQQHLDLPKVHTLKGRTIEIRARRPVFVHVDDQTRYKDHVTCRTASGALKVMVDRL